MSQEEPFDRTAFHNTRRELLIDEYHLMTPAIRDFINNKCAAADFLIGELKRVALDDLRFRFREGHSDASASGFLSYEIVKMIDPDFVYPDDLRI